jgi:hypothetical protein
VTGLPGWQPLSSGWGQQWVHDLVKVRNREFGRVLDQEVLEWNIKSEVFVTQQDRKLIELFEPLCGVKIGVQLKEVRVQFERCSRL